MMNINTIKEALKKLPSGYKPFGPMIMYPIEYAFWKKRGYIKYNRWAGRKVLISRPFPGMEDE